MLPKLREILKNTSEKNQSLQDILKTSSYCDLVLTIEKWVKGIHNTKITLEFDLGDFTPKGEDRYLKRVHFYNRLHLRDIIDPKYVAPEYNLDAIIADLNIRYRHDFTRDDLDIVDDYLVARETSLGYIGDSGVRVIPPFAYQHFTTSLYPFHHLEVMTVGLKPTLSKLQEVVQHLKPDGFIPTVTPLDGELRDLLRLHIQPLEDAFVPVMKVLDGDLRTLLSRHDQPVEDFFTTRLVCKNGTLDFRRVEHNTQPIESFDIGLKTLNGELK